MTPLTDAELTEVAVAMVTWVGILLKAGQEERAGRVDALYAKIAALNEGAERGC